MSFSCCASLNSFYGNNFNMAIKKLFRAKLALCLMIFSSIFALCACRAELYSNADVITACQQTIFGYAHSRDAIDLDKNAALFTENATLKIGETRLSGRAEIKASLADRGPKQVTFHVISSASINIEEDESISGESYALVYVAPTASSNSNQPKSLTLKYLLTYQDDFKLIGGTSLIQNRNILIDTVTS